MTNTNVQQYVSIAIRLAEYYNTKEILDWINSPHPQLEGELPINLIKFGYADKVHEVLDRLDADAYL